MERQQKKEWTSPQVCRFCRHCMIHETYDEMDQAWHSGWFCQKDIPEAYIDDEMNVSDDFCAEWIWYADEDNPHTAYVLTCPDWQVPITQSEFDARLGRTP